MGELAKSRMLVAVAARGLGQARYAAAQSVRVAWYMAQARLVQGLAANAGRAEPRYRPRAAAGDRKRVRAAFLDLFAADLENIQAGLYPAPKAFSPRAAVEALAQAGGVLADLPQVTRRKAGRNGVEVRERAADLGIDPARYPAYYLQNFHYQSGGWLTRESADLYDAQVEVLFGGAADAMRRLALGHLARAWRGVDQRGVRHLDLACGNGRFLTQILEAFPKIRATGLDLSAPYIEAARERLKPWRQAELCVGAAESAPFDDASFDSVSVIYLFHELPPKVRNEVAREIARVLKPGGALVLADSAQTGDHADLDRMLELFPVQFHEPFFASYLKEDLPALFAAHGLVEQARQLGFLTKIVRFTKRAPG